MKKLVSLASLLIAALQFVPVAQACSPQMSYGSCINGTQQVTVVACDGSITHFDQRCEKPHVYSCTSCSAMYSSNTWCYVQLTDGHTDANTGTAGVIDGFNTREECQDARSSDSWCSGNP